MALAIEIYGRNMEVTDHISDYVNKKVSKLDRYLPGIEEARVDLALIKSARSAADRQVAQITVRGRGFILRSEERGEDVFAAFDTAMDKMQRQMERYKGKHYHGRGDGRSAADVSAPPEDMVLDEDTGELRPAIMRRKKFVLTPMNELEALEQMALLGHENFFVFFNANTNSINVLYHRRDGSYGLIEPQLG
jgi:putative sigma-54 modulation protein